MTETKQGTIRVFEPWGEEEVIEVTPFPDGTPIGEVSVSVGQKINTGNYENVSIHVSVKLPCVATDEGVRRAQAQAATFCEEKLHELGAEVLG